MPNSVIKSISKKTGKSIGEVEKAWDKATSIVKSQYGKKKEDDKFFALVTTITKKMVSKEAVFLGVKNGSNH